MKNNAFNEILKKVKNVNILEKLDNPKVLLEYLDLESKIKNDFQPEIVLDKSDLLFSEHIDIEEKKHIIIQLANIDKIEAYKKLKRYSEKPNKELTDFIKIALQESKALLQSTLLEEPSILITSLLGGKENKLRFFSLITKKDFNTFSLWQKNIIEKEFFFLIYDYQGEIEEINIYEHFATIVFLLPYHITPHQVIKEIINNINFFGNFLNEKFMVRNDKILDINQSKEEAKKLINNSDKNTNPQFISDINNPTDNEK